MRLKNLEPEYGQRCYDDALQHIESFEPRNQSSWYFHAHGLIRAASTAYVIGLPLSESRAWLQKATEAFRQLFALRGTTFTKTTRYRAGKPLPEETIAEDGYTSHDSMLAVYAALILGDVPLAKSLVDLAGPSPNDRLVAPRSQVCTTSVQKLSHALNALVAGDLELAEREANRPKIRRGTKTDRLLADAFSALATGGDALTARDEILKHHATQAKRDLNPAASSFWLCFPALAVSALAMHLQGCELSQLETDSVYCPIGLLEP
jgi:hypothetical protein